MNQATAQVAMASVTGGGVASYVGLDVTDEKNGEEAPKEYDEDGNEVDADGKPVEKSAKSCLKQNVNSALMYIISIGGWIAAIAGPASFDQIWMWPTAIVTMWAGYQLWLLGSLAEQLEKFEKENNRYKVLNDKLKAQTAEFEAQNEELKGNVDQLEKQNIEMASNVQALSATNDALGTQVGELGGNVEKLELQNNIMDQANQKLSTDVENLGAVKDELEQSLQGFSALEANIRKIQEETGQNFDEAFANCDEVFNKLGGVANKLEIIKNEQQKLLIAQARTTLTAEINRARAEADRAGDRDDTEGMNEKEWVRFQRRLPKIVKNMFTRQHSVGSGFQAVDKDGDGTISYDEINDMLDDLYEKNKDALLDEQIRTIDRQKSRGSPQVEEGTGL